MPTTLVKDVLWRVSDQLGDTAPQFQRFPEAVLVQWLVDAQVAIAKFMPSATARTDAVKLAQGSKQSIETILQANCVPGDGVSLTAPLYGIEIYSVVRNMGVDGSTVGNGITVVDRADLDNFNPQWHQQTGTAVDDYVFDERNPLTFYVSPAVPASPAVWVEINYAAMPKAIPAGGAVGSEVYKFSGSNAQTITIHDKHVDDVVNYIMARAEMKNSKFADSRGAPVYGALFADSINAQMKALTGVNPNLKTLPGNTSP